LNQDLFAFFVAALLFASGIGGLAYQAWGDPGDEEVSETRKTALFGLADRILPPLIMRPKIRKPLRTVAR
jgi:hypothetical protein